MVLKKSDIAYAVALTEVSGGNAPTPDGNTTDAEHAVVNALDEDEGVGVLPPRSPNCRLGIMALHWRRASPWCRDNYGVSNETVYCSKEICLVVGLDSMEHY
ncbi:unnamed protein product [Cuscuta campestris]|uniref:Uncharacterized protein n=1 Tax=Cuscuta campestris TaxID=132261 RepID=A0A484LB54_9ASTE|nr:unnamed protein product [Cuscuta campestris]